MNMSQWPHSLMTGASEVCKPCSAAWEHSGHLRQQVLVSDFISRKSNKHLNNFSCA
jgi:hypothetical protein